MICLRKLARRDDEEGVQRKARDIIPIETDHTIRKAEITDIWRGLPLFIRIPCLLPGKTL